VTSLEIRPLTAGDDLDAQRDLGERAFGPMPPAYRERWRQMYLPAIEEGRYLGVFDGGDQVGGAGWHDMTQWWGGEPLPMAGIASVKVAPEARGQGLGRQLMTEVLRAVAARGYPVSALYPATMPIYRSLGWELAGAAYHAVVPGRALRSLTPPDPALARGPGGPSDLALPGGPAGSFPPAGTSGGSAALPELRRATEADAGEVLAVFGRAFRAARASGEVARDLGSVQYWLANSPEVYCYLCDDGFIAYRWDPAAKGLVADFLAAATPQAQRALLSLLAGHSSTARTVEFRASPASPLWWQLRERDAQLTRSDMWMLRLTDVRAAIERRGYPGAVAGSASLTVIDKDIEANAGTWTFTLDGGQATLERATPGPAGPRAAGGPALTVGPRGLAALYAGTPVPTLRQAGLVAGGTPEADDLLTAAFAGTASMMDDF
jgi:predicted acetyltransferase